MTLLDLCERPSPPEPTNANIVAYVEHVKPTQTAKEAVVIELLTRYLAETGHADATGGELAAWSGMPVTSIRPRLTGLRDKRSVQVTASMRPSRADGEKSCHAYWVTR